MAGNEEREVIEAARPSLANMTQTIVKPDITGHFERKQYMVKLIGNMWVYLMKTRRGIFRISWKLQTLTIIRTFPRLCQADTFPLFTNQGS